MPPVQAGAHFHIPRGDRPGWAQGEGHATPTPPGLDKGAHRASHPNVATAAWCPLLATRLMISHPPWRQQAQGLVNLSLLSLCCRNKFDRLDDRSFDPRIGPRLYPGRACAAGRPRLPTQSRARGSLKIPVSPAAAAIPALRWHEGKRPGRSRRHRSIERSILVCPPRLAKSGGTRT